MQVPFVRYTRAWLQRSRCSSCVLVHVISENSLGYYPSNVTSWTPRQVQTALQVQIDFQRTLMLGLRRYAVTPVQLGTCKGNVRRSTKLARFCLPIKSVNKNLSSVRQKSTEFVGWWNRPILWSKIEPLSILDDKIGQLFGHQINRFCWCLHSDIVYSEDEYFLVIYFVCYSIIFIFIHQMQNK